MKNLIAAAIMIGLIIGSLIFFLPSRKNADDVRIEEISSIHFEYITIDGCEYIEAFQDDRAISVMHSRQCHYCDSVRKELVDEILKDYE